MKLLIVVCEGQTEQEFCNDVLFSHFFQHDILLKSPTIKQSKGGLVKWDVLKRQITEHLNENAVVTTLLDFYGKSCLALVLSRQTLQALNYLIPGTLWSMVELRGSWWSLVEDEP